MDELCEPHLSGNGMLVVDDQLERGETGMLGKNGKDGAKLFYRGWRISRDHAMLKEEGSLSGELYVVHIDRGIPVNSRERGLDRTSEAFLYEYD